jgi:hypothetical protein
LLQPVKLGADDRERFLVIHNRQSETRLRIRHGPFRGDEQTEMLAKPAETTEIGGHGRDRFDESLI